MNLRADRARRDARATWAEIARESGHDWRTVKPTWAPDAPARPARQAPLPTIQVCDRRLHPRHRRHASERAPAQGQASSTNRLVADHGFAAQLPAGSSSTWPPADR